MDSWLLLADICHVIKRPQHLGDHLWPGHRLILFLLLDLVTLVWGGHEGALDDGGAVAVEAGVPGVEDVLKGADVIDGDVQDVDLGHLLASETRFFP